MTRLHSRPALFVLVVGVVVWLAGCSDGSATTTARVTTAAPATTSLESPSTQSAIDAVGDVKGENGQAAPADLKPLGDIESVQLGLEKNNLVLQVRMATAPPDPLLVAQLEFVLSIRMDEQNGYELSTVGLPGWTGGVMWGSPHLYDVATAQIKALNEKPSATGNVLRMVVPLSQMPKLKSPLRWNVTFEWRKDGDLFTDRVPDVGDDALNPKQLQLPPESP